MPFDYEDFARDVAKDASTDIVSGLVVAGVKGVFRVARAGFNALAADEAESLSDDLEVPEEMLAQTVVDDFLNALHSQDHDFACALCAHAMLEHPVRQAALQATLDAAVPIAWTYVEAQELKQNQSGPTYVVFVLDVEFETEPGHEFLQLQVHVRWLGSEWRIWDLVWVEYAE